MVVEQREVLRKGETVGRRIYQHFINIIIMTDCLMLLVLTVNQNGSQPETNQYDYRVIRRTETKNYETRHTYVHTTKRTVTSLCVTAGGGIWRQLLKNSFLVYVLDAYFIVTTMILVVSPISSWFDHSLFFIHSFIHSLYTIMLYKGLFLLIFFLLLLHPADAYLSSATPPFFRKTAILPRGGSTTVAPPNETTTRKTTRRPTKDSSANPPPTKFDVRKEGPLEYLQDDDYLESRNPEDPFHILLLEETFEKPKITVNYVSSSLSFVLDMPHQDALDAALFAKDQGMSCLGTWTRENCLRYGRELQLRDLCVRVVPYSPGSSRGWQAKDVGNQQDLYSNKDAEYWALSESD
jgi:hypothetical protein